MKCFKYQEELHNALRKNLHCNMRETEVAEIVGSICGNWQGDIISGSRSAEIEGSATDRVIKKGDCMIVDIQYYSDGMWSDITRTYFFGEPSAFQKSAYNELLCAIKCGEGLLKGGVRCSDIYRALSVSIKSKYKFTHHAGHLIGSQPLIKPRFFPYSDDTLPEGAAVTLEPGIYVPGDFGIRLENNYIITELGCRNLFDYSLDINDYII